MSLPPGFLDELRTRLSLTDVVGRKVMWDTRKSNQGKGDMWAPCPFHQEKTASFHVDDRKGFYYCFGCHAKGDAISFVRETENVGFMEAVEILAGEAGMQMPERDPRAQEKSDRRGELAKVMEAAVRWLRLQLKTGAASDARAYLDRRGLGDKTQERFEIGFAPDQRQAMWQALTGQGIEGQKIIDAGLAAEPDGGGQPYDRFRGRIIYPIRDPRGRCIGLGGRAMAADARAKYLNSPETELFDKGRSLYNHSPAREAAGKGQPLIVAEGYMDVIALVEAGFEAAVAPLGTAVTEDQLRLLWRIDPEPIIALDGDKAGLRAAMRLIDLALPLLEAGQSLRFCLMPEGQDPDDLIRAAGPPAMQTLLDKAEPMVRLLWRRETEGAQIDSPERRAALDKRLRAAVKTIADPSIRSHYGEEIRRLRAELFGQGRRDFVPRKRGWTPPATAQATTRASVLATGDAVLQEHLREAVILATLITHPALRAEFAHVLEEVSLTGPNHAKVATALLRCPPDADLAGFPAEIDREVLETLLNARHVQLSPSMRHPSDTDLARMCLTEELAKLAAARGAEREISDAMDELSGVANEGVDWRLAQAAAARQNAVRGMEADVTEFEIAPNGARLDREERSALDKLLDGITFGKSGKDTEG
ncbi:DNA primase [Actibacterium sp. 188UL27-1]|uniref:DNA primase n=1 Tax=Actibacterium sp. 188UL27-1 TaxID=2786961 RepID=UPI001959A7EC|nr:DNA primase [Actibacterium sp. 188UL27-1]MBM7069213.1 DNA primase [Actibacterium sp. 188UL27-1]